MPRCSGKCELQITKIINNPITATISTDPHNAPMPATWATKQDSDAATAALLARINQWAVPAAMSGCPVFPPTNPLVNPAPLVCICTQTGPNPDWANMPTLTRRFAEKFKSGGNNFEAWVDIDYQIGYVVGTCLEPPGMVFYSMGETGIIEGQGLAVLSTKEGGVTTAMLEKIRKALG